MECSLVLDAGERCAPTIRKMGSRVRYAIISHFKWKIIMLTSRSGDVYSLMLGSKTLIVLSSDVAVKELLDRRSATYSDRQEMYIGQELCSGGLRMLMMVSRRSLAVPYMTFC